MLQIPSLAARHATTTTHASTTGRPLATKVKTSFLGFIPDPVLILLPMLVEADETSRRSGAPDVPQSRLSRVKNGHRGTMNFCFAQLLYDGSAPCHGSCTPSR